MRVCPSCLGSGKRWEEALGLGPNDYPDLQAANCEQCGGSGKISIRMKHAHDAWEIWSWKGLFFILILFEILTQSPLFILYLFRGGGPMENLTIWHYISAVGAAAFIPLFLAAIPPIALVAGILTILGFPLQ